MIRTSLLLLALIPGLAFAEGGDYEPDDIEVQGEVVRDGGQVLIKNSLRSYRIPAANASAVGALHGREVHVRGVTGAREVTAGGVVIDISLTGWIEPRPTSAEGVVQSGLKGLLLMRQEGPLALVVPQPLVPSLEGRQVKLSGFAYQGRDVPKLVVSSVTANVKQDLADEDLPYLSRREPIAGQPGRFTFDNTREDERKALRGASVQVVDMEIYSKATQTWREVEEGTFDPETDRLMAEARMGRQRDGEQSIPQGWIPARKLDFGVLVDPLASQSVRDKLFGTPAPDDATTGGGIEDTLQQFNEEQDYREQQEEE